MKWNDPKSSNKQIKLKKYLLTPVLLLLHRFNHSPSIRNSIRRSIFEEAWRILPSGGAISIMDMNPRSIFFKKFASNPFAFAAFKSTEPWLNEYISMDLERTLEGCGFRAVTVMENSPRHRTVVAYK